MNYYDILHAEFDKESDRAAVILVGSIVDELLKSLLSAHLVAVTSSKDDLFDGPNAPLSDFNARIEMAYRLGIVSVKFTRDLHLIRKIRNEFAHNIHGCSFNDARVSSRIVELTKSHGIIGRSKHKYPEILSTRDQFLQSASWMTWHLTQEIKETQSIQPKSEEWGYTFIWKEEQETSAEPDSMAQPALTHESI